MDGNGGDIEVKFMSTDNFLKIGTLGDWRLHIDHGVRTITGTECTIAPYWTQQAGRVDYVRLPRPHNPQHPQWNAVFFGRISKLTTNELILVEVNTRPPERRGTDDEAQP